MKKILATTIILGLVLITLSTVVSASKYEKVGTIPELEGSNEIIDIANDGAGIENKQKLQHRNRLKNKFGSAEEKRAHIKFKGVWGYNESNETQGYLGGFAYRKGRFGIIKGLWNTTDNSSYGKFGAILRKGFLNGIVINSEGERAPISGFYKIDLEEETLKIRWMTLNRVGWAYCQLELPD
jgi:hypothetical protein